MKVKLWRPNVSKLLILVLSLLILIVITVQARSSASDTAVAPEKLPRVNAATTYALSETGRYIIQFREAPLATYAGGVPGLDATSRAATGAEELDLDSPASVAYRQFLTRRQDVALAEMAATLGRSLDVLHRYEIVFNGTAVELSAAEVAELAATPGVARIFPEEIHYPDTDYGPAWIGAPEIWDGTATGGEAGNQGEGIIIGVLDTGINYDHPSFAAVGPIDGYTHTNPLPGGDYLGLCAPAANPSLCNDKLIGLWDFVDGTDESDGADDSNGHGSHTASTAAGNVVTATLSTPTTYEYEASISGMAPHANIIAYDVCTTGCPSTATLAAIEQAMQDGVDVVNYSISGGDDPYNDAMELAFLNARAMGIFVAASAGNSGPDATTVAHRSPWVTAVAASTHDRQLANALIDMSGGDSTPPADIDGVSITPGYGPAEIVYAGDYGNALCASGDPESPTNPFPNNTFNGEIVICDRGTYARVDKGFFVAQAGAGGYILANDAANGDGLTADAHYLPAVHITYDDGVALKAWVAGGGMPMGTIAGTTAASDAANGDVMASFSSRGPSTTLPDVLKPDIAAPGVDILAAYRDGEEYSIISGTSMASPHVAGSAALLMALHSDWTPAEIQSAMMMTAVPDVREEDGVTDADPFDTGSGRIELRRAGEAGLVLDETLSNYQQAHPVTGTLQTYELNLASLANANCIDVCAWSRTFSSTLDSAVQWTAGVDAPDGVDVTVTPSVFTVGAGGSQTITVEVDVTEFNAALNGRTDGWLFGSVTLTATDQHLLRLPIGVQKQYSSALDLLSKTPKELTVSPGQLMTYTVRLENHDNVTNTYTLTDTLPVGATFVSGSPGLTHDNGVLTWSGEIGPAEIQYVVTDLGTESGINYIDAVTDLGVSPDSTLCNAVAPPNPCAGAALIYPLSDLDYSFDFYSDTITDTIVTSAGVTLGFDGWQGSACPVCNQSLPEPTEINQLIASLWRYMDPEGLTAPAGWYAFPLSGLLENPSDVVFYVSWQDVPQATGASVNTTHAMAVVLDGQSEPSGRIYMMYDDTSNAANLAANGYTIGVENKTGTSGTTYAFTSCPYGPCIPGASVGSAPANGTTLMFDPVRTGDNYYREFTYTVLVDGATLGDVLTNKVVVSSDSPDEATQLMQAQADVTVAAGGGTAPTAAFNSNSPIAVGSQAVFTNTTTGDAPISYVWDFGDGNDSTAVHPTHTYGSAGAYTVALTATNDFGSDVVAHAFVVDEETAAEPPTAAFSHNGPVDAGQTVQFSNSSTGSGTLIYDWDFGDGGGSTAANPTHVYGEGGAYTVTLTVTNTAGSDVATDTVNVHYVVYIPTVLRSP